MINVSLAGTFQTSIFVQTATCGSFHQFLVSHARYGHSDIRNGFSVENWVQKRWALNLMTSFWRQKPVSCFPAKPLTGRARISRPFCTVINSNISRHLAGRGRETPTFWRETSFWRQNSRHHLSTSSPLDPIFNGEPISGLKMPVSRRPCKLGTTDKNTRLKCPQMGLPMTHGSRDSSS